MQGGDAFAAAIGVATDKYQGAKRPEKEKEQDRLEAMSRNSVSRYGAGISLAMTNAGCDRSGAPIVRGVDLTLGPGEAVQLFGPNGSGKTSLLALLAGHIEPAEGSVLWRRAEVEAGPAPFAGSVFFLGHEASVKSALTAEENLLFWAALYNLKGAEARQQVSDALARLGISRLRNYKAGRLSAGQRRRIDLGRALLARRPVWLLDEPVAALDSEGDRIVSGVIAEHLEEGGLAVIATHDTLEVTSRRVELSL